MFCLDRRTCWTPARITKADTGLPARAVVKLAEVEQKITALTIVREAERGQVAAFPGSAARADAAER